MRLRYFLIAFSFLKFMNNLNNIKGEWCTKVIPVTKTQNRWQTGYREVHRRYWWGGRYTTTEPYQYLSNQHYTTYESIRQCCSGYKEDNGYCEPICRPECPLNSNCSLPFVCTCNEGFTMTSNICLPVCSKGCPKYSKCMEPEKCGCEDGYEMNDDNSECLPRCSLGCSVNSLCIQPEICECVFGYHESNGFCNPICEPKCSENSFCQEPNQCACFNGYGRQAVTDKQCSPICTLGCPAYSSCISPDNCKCENGYEMNENSTECNAICTEACPPNSVCYRPQECLCSEGYVLKNLTGVGLHCEPNCTDNCQINGKCVTPNVCECFLGYEMQFKDPNEQLCQPKCSQNCMHGVCFAPDVCVCDPGYLMGPNNTCAPVCSMSCINGKCLEPEICVCNEGHKLLSNSVHICEPICEPTCVFGDCVAPNFCVCWQHYQPNASNIFIGDTGTFETPHVCVPVCKFECLNGFCSSPNECSCNEGYETHAYMRNECFPKCEGCSYGDCVAPNACHCWEGYESVSDTVNEEEKCFLSSTPLMESNFQTTTTIDYSSTTNLASVVDFYTIKNETDQDTDEEVLENEVTESKTLLQRPANNTSDKVPNACQDRCACWQQSDEYGQLNNIKCLRICVDNSDVPCLTIHNCVCHFDQLQLTCNATDDFSMEDMPIRYICKVRLYPKSNQQLSQTEQNKLHGFQSAWIWVLCAILGTIVVSTLFAIIWRRYKFARNSNDTADFVVNMHQ